MIDKNELRFGNIIKRRSSDEIIVIDTFDVFKRVVRLSVTHSYVPLTEEWLLKFGFEYDSLSDTSVLDCKKHNLYFCISIKGHYFSILQESKHEEVISVTHLLYVHQLQNLYFALTGQEMTLNPLLPLP